MKIMKNMERKKFGRYRFEEADLDLNLSDEITGNLRTMKAAGNLLHDRFKSLQKRNIIETRIRAKPTKTKMKKYEKRSVREVGEKLSTKINLLYGFFLSNVLIRLNKNK